MPRWSRTSWSSVAFCVRWASASKGRGRPTIRVEAPERCRGAKHVLAGDYIEAGSWGVVAAITGGEIVVTGARAEDIEVIAAPLKKMGLRCSYEDDRFAVESSTLTATRRLTTGLWPGFPSDMVSLVTVLATQADGRTLVHDWLYELRLFALEQLSAMRADLFLCDPHRIIVSGPTRLRGRLLDARDLRSGMALIAAALAAAGRESGNPARDGRAWLRVACRAVALAWRGRRTGELAARFFRRRRWRRDRHGHAWQRALKRLRKSDRRLQRLRERRRRLAHAARARWRRRRWRRFELFIPRLDFPRHGRRLWRRAHPADRVPGGTAADPIPTDRAPGQCAASASARCRSAASAG